MFGVGLGDNC
jgi:hypothetical protein